MKDHALHRKAVQTGLAMMLATAAGLGVTLLPAQAQISSEVRTSPVIRGDIVERLLKELTDLMEEYFELTAELHRVAAQMRPLEIRIEELLDELEKPVRPPTQEAIMDELIEVASEWSALRYVQLNLIQELEYVLGLIDDLEDQIARARAASKAPRSGVAEESFIPEVLTEPHSTGKR
jgi:hypothetical protein